MVWRFSQPSRADYLNTCMKKSLEDSSGQSTNSSLGISSSMSSDSGELVNPLADVSHWSDSSSITALRERKNGIL